MLKTGSHIETGVAKIIELHGRVQGVGMRPFVYNLAADFGLRGSVCNDSRGVFIRIFGKEDSIKSFSEKLFTEAPPLSEIERSDIRSVAKANPLFHELKSATQFKILEPATEGSISEQAFALKITPDTGICDSCSDDILTAGNRRNRYAFTSCTDCGPRYGILNTLPFERRSTSFGVFAVCPFCESEYHDPKDRRFWAQTVSCPICGPIPKLSDRDGNLIASEDGTFGDAIRLLQAGKILAVKSLSGYLLLCDANNSSSIAALRERKKRARKPFALLSKDVNAAKELCRISDFEEEALSSRQKPIVLLQKRKGASDLVCEGVAPGLSTLGVMLPHNGILLLLADLFGKPLVCTSGNISGSPIFSNDKKAFSGLRRVADAFLHHNLEIQRAQDDSVLRFTSEGKRIFLRRSRGFAPEAPDSEIIPQVAGFGAALKSAFSLGHGHLCMLSQSLGNTLESWEAQEVFRTEFDSLKSMVGCKPEAAVTDLHPDFFVHRFAKEFAEKEQIPFIGIQHHEAHASAVLAEHKLLQSEEKVLCVVWDGMGLGHEGEISGSEFLLYAKGESGHFFEHTGRMEGIAQLGGDRMARSPLLSALSILHRHDEISNLLFQKGNFSRNEWEFYRKQARGSGGVKNHSMGRIFDAVASLCLVDKELISEISYEGEAAIHLETLALRFFSANKKSLKKAAVSDSLSTFSYKGSKSASDILEQVYQDSEAGTLPEEVAFKFHLCLVQLIKNHADSVGVKHLAFSGGCFQNALLTELLQMFLPDYHLFFHEELSPNDESIAFGQLFHPLVRKSLQK